MFSELAENCLLKKIIGGDVTEEEVKNTSEGLQYCLSVMDSRQEIMDIYKKYGLKEGDYKGFRKLGKRFKVAIEINKIKSRNEEERQKAINIARKSKLFSILHYYFSR